MPCADFAQHESEIAAVAHREDAVHRWRQSHVALEYAPAGLEFCGSRIPNRHALAPSRQNVGTPSAQRHGTTLRLANLAEGENRPGAPGGRPIVESVLIVRALPAACVLIVLASSYAGADDTPPPIATDRPAVTDSSVVVPPGSLQFENGFADTVTQGQTTFDFPETLLRLGVASKTELRLTAPDFFDQSGAGSGFGDVTIGIKQQLGPAAGFDVSLVLSLSLPTGARAFSSHGYDPSVQLPWSRALSKNWTIAGMCSVYGLTENGRRNVTGETTFLFDRQLTSRWDAFAEYAGDFPEQGGPRHLLHFGTAYKIAPEQQLDFHFGVGLSAAAVDHFFGIGYSFRLQAFAQR